MKRVKTLGHLLDEIEILMRQLSRLLCFDVLRNYNKVAHELARFAARCHNSCTWSEDFPP